MIIKKITLKNIRSYEFQEIVFPDGATLLSGDIGSGKTSVLLGIEFALFGLQPGQRGASLLRNGVTEGGVILEFSMGDMNIIVERTLKKGKTISQDLCNITIDGKKYDLSVTELKDKVLEILNYPREFVKKQNILYKFTVYTPQEEMKQIITEEPQARINALRHVFGIDKYKRILENLSILTSKLREEKKVKEGSIESLEQDKFDLVSKEYEMEAKYVNLESVKKELFLMTEERKKIQQEKDEISEKIEERKKIQQEIEKTKIMISTKKETFANNLKLLQHMEAQIKEVSEMKFREESISEIEQKLNALKIEKENLDNENLQITSQINSLNLKNSENDLLKKKLSLLEMCPTCLQNVDPVYKSNVFNKIDSDLVEHKKRINQLSIEKDSVMKQLFALNELLSLEEKGLHNMRILRIKFYDAEEKKKRLDDFKRTSNAIQKDIEILNNHLDILCETVFELNKFNNIFELKQKEFDTASRKERTAEIKVAELKKEIEVFSRHIEELKERIKRIEEIKKKLDYIASLEVWLSKNISPLISLVERNVMLKLRAEFLVFFSKWFSMLVPDAFDIRLDDDFTPIIEYHDYEIDYSYLSGGERTAVALAYRLSLNQVINSFLSKIKTKGLVILDEPTDGFSEQQLDKMRDVLRQLEAEQLIIVSHEQKIEGFVENVIRFSKEHGISKIVQEN